MTCGNCETNPVLVPDKTIYVKNLILSETDDLKIDTPQFDNENDFLYDDPNLVTICNLLVPLGNDML